MKQKLVAGSAEGRGSLLALAIVSLIAGAASGLVGVTFRFSQGELTRQPIKREGQSA